MNSLNARESTLQRKGIKAKRANTNVTNAAKIDTRLYPCLLYTSDAADE